MSTILVILLLGTNWLWWIFFTSYRRTIQRELKKQQPNKPNGSKQ